jgi:hypothetical protein
LRRMPRRAALGPAGTVRAHGHVHRVLDAGAARPAADMRRVQAADRKGAAAVQTWTPVHVHMRVHAHARVHVHVRARVHVHVLYAAWGAWRVCPWDCWARLRLQPERAPLTHRCYARRCRPESCGGFGFVRSRVAALSSVLRTSPGGCVRAPCRPSCVHGDSHGVPRRRRPTVRCIIP